MRENLMKNVCNQKKINIIKHYHLKKSINLEFLTGIDFPKSITLKDLKAVVKCNSLLPKLLLIKSKPH